MKKDVMIIRVAGGSQVSGVSGSIAKSIRANKDIEIHAIGASAISQAVKSITTARGILATSGIDLLIKTGFGTTVIDGQERTMIIFKPVLN